MKCKKVYGQPPENKIRFASKAHNSPKTTWFLQTRTTQFRPWPNASSHWDTIGLLDHIQCQAKQPFQSHHRAARPMDLLISPARAHTQRTCTSRSRNKVGCSRENLGPTLRAGICRGQYLPPLGTLRRTALTASLTAEFMVKLVSEWIFQPPVTTTGPWKWADGFFTTEDDDVFLLSLIFTGTRKKICRNADFSKEIGSNTSKKWKRLYWAVRGPAEFRERLRPRCAFATTEFTAALPFFWSPIFAQLRLAFRLTELPCEWKLDH